MPAQATAMRQMAALRASSGMRSSSSSRRMRSASMRPSISSASSRPVNQGTSFFTMTGGQSLKAAASAATETTAVRPSAHSS